VQLVRDLVYASVLPLAVAGQTETLGAIDDRTWALLAPLRDLIYLDEGKRYGWILSFIDQDGRGLMVPGVSDPVVYDGEELPVGALAASLAELEKEGWSVDSLHVEHYGPEWGEFELADPDEEAVKAVECSFVRSPSISTLSSNAQTRAIDEGSAA
jgi:hypothetical protein